MRVTMLRGPHKGSIRDLSTAQALAEIRAGGAAAVDAQPVSASAPALPETLYVSATPDGAGWIVQNIRGGQYLQKDGGWADVPRTVPEIPAYCSTSAPPVTETRPPVPAPAPAPAEVAEVPQETETVADATDEAAPSVPLDAEPEPEPTAEDVDAYRPNRRRRR